MNEIGTFGHLERAGDLWNFRETSGRPKTVYFVGSECGTPAAEDGVPDTVILDQI